MTDTKELKSEVITKLSEIDNVVYKVERLINIGMRNIHDDMFDDAFICCDAAIDSIRELKDNLDALHQYCRDTIY